MKPDLRIASLLVCLMLASCSSPPPLMMHKGEELHSRLHSGKLRVAVLPTADYGTSPSLCQSFVMGGCYGILTPSLAYENGGETFTNELTMSLWKQNVCRLAKKAEIQAACERHGLSKDALFPPPVTLMGMFSPATRAIESPDDVGNGRHPNYDLMYRIGEELSVDLVLMSRLSANASTKVCTYGGGAVAVPGLFPYSLIPGFLQGVYNSFISPTNVQALQVDLIAVDVRNRTVLAYGGFGAQEWAKPDERPQKLDTYGKAMVYYFNLPDDETKRKKALASAASFASTLTVNMILNGLTGLQVGVGFNFEYDIEDVTWQQYGPGYFEENYAWRTSEYNRALGE